MLVRDGTGRCPAHPQINRFADKRRGTRQQRGYGGEWDRVRLVILKRDAGLCQPCMTRGVLTIGKAVDHIVPKAEGGTDDEGNLQTICKACHVVKTAEEARRGVDRGWGASNL